MSSCQQSHISIYTICKSIRVAILIIFRFVRRQMVSPKPVYYMCRQHETLNCRELHKQLSNSCHSKLMSNLNHANNFDSVVFILACLYCEVRVVRTKFWCKMAGVTFDTIIAITIPRADLVCMSSG